MELAVVERMVPGFWYATVPASDGPFPAVLVLHAPADAMAGWAARDATLFAAHGFAAMALHQEDVAGAVAAMRAQPFCNGRVGIFTVGAGAQRLAAALADARPDAIAMHAPSPVDEAVFARNGGPLFLSHGCADEFFPVETSRRLEQAVAGTEAYFYEGQDHGINDETQANLNTQRFLSFFERHLK